MRKNPSAIKDAITIREVLIARGAQVSYRNRTRCPLHRGDNPQSFAFNDTHFRCFACGAHGDVIALVQALLHVDFPNALAFCARLAGVDMKQPSRAAIRRLTRQRKQAQNEALRARLAVEHRWQSLVAAHHDAQADCKFLETSWSRDRDADDVLTQHALDDLSAAYMRREVVEWELEETAAEFHQPGSSCQPSRPRESETAVTSRGSSRSHDELILRGLSE